MSVKFYPLTVKRIVRETDDCVSIVFNVPDTLKKTFMYNQGQHLTIKANVNGEEVRRNYSLCSSPMEKDWRVAVKKIPGGAFSSYANDYLKQGDILDVMPPMGHFYTTLNKDAKKKYMAFAAGSGITPIISIIKTTLLTELGSTFTLFYGNRDKGSIIFKEELEALKNKFISRFRVYHILSREKTDAAINYGRIDTAKCQYIFEKLVDAQQIDNFFICGPEEMIFSVKNHLQSMGVATEKIHFELFTTPTVQNQPKIHPGSQANKIERSDVSKVTIKLDGIESSFNLAYDGESILDAALRKKADLPYACKGGVCCTCKAKLEEGEVEMDVNYSLEPDEIKAGFILTCQSHPKTPQVKINFDVK